MIDNSCDSEKNLLRDKGMIENNVSYLKTKSEILNGIKIDTNSRNLKMHQNLVKTAQNLNAPNINGTNETWKNCILLSNELIKINNEYR